MHRRISRACWIELGDVLPLLFPFPPSGLGFPFSAFVRSILLFPPCRSLKTSHSRWTEQGSLGGTMYTNAFCSFMTERNRLLTRKNELAHGRANDSTSAMVSSGSASKVVTASALFVALFSASASSPAAPPPPDTMFSELMLPAWRLRRSGELDEAEPAGESASVPLRRRFSSRPRNDAEARRDVEWCLCRVICSARWFRYTITSSSVLALYNSSE
mmetsp:Transcript_8523/g.20601  ORF Transcript_8523/g.20601 Transcript_8523/m.20601 type:complete len:216 (+) Transcript_8523:1256-1903(+)